MKKIFALCFLFTMAMMTFAQETKKVAILEVVDREGKLSYSQKLMLRSNLAKAVTNTYGYEAYDRSDVDAIMGEQDFQRTGMVSDEEIRKLGEMTGVSFILVSEGALTDDKKLFVAVKLLNVETAKGEMTDNTMMGLSSAEMQKGCESLANTLFVKVETSSSKRTTSVGSLKQTKNDAVKNTYGISRINNNEYLCQGTTMDKKAYEKFLRDNCPSAYAQYNKGKKLITAGWCCFGLGLAGITTGAVLMALYPPFPQFGVYSSFGYDYYKMGEGEYQLPEYKIGAACVGLGAASLATSVPLLAVGYIKRNKSCDIYNQQCATPDKKPMSLNLIAGENGLGLALQF